MFTLFWQRLKISDNNNKNLPAGNPSNRADGMTMLFHGLANLRTTRPLELYSTPVIAQYPGRKKRSGCRLQMAVYHLTGYWQTKKRGSIPFDGYRQ